MLKVLSLIILMIVSIPAFAALNEDDSNLPKKSVKELREEQLNESNKICVSAQCYTNNYAGSDIGECSTPQILPEGTFDPCNPTQTASTSSSENTFER